MLQQQIAVCQEQLTDAAEANRSRATAILNHKAEIGNLNANVAQLKEDLEAAQQQCSALHKARHKCKAAFADMQQRRHLQLQQLFEFQLGQFSRKVQSGLQAIAQQPPAPELKRQTEQLFEGNFKGCTLAIARDMAHLQGHQRCWPVNQVQAAAWNKERAALQVCCCKGLHHSMPLCS